VLYKRESLGFRDRAICGVSHALGDELKPSFFQGLFSCRDSAFEVF